MSTDQTHDDAHLPAPLPSTLLCVRFRRWIFRARSTSPTLRCFQSSPWLARARPHRCVRCRPAGPDLSRCRFPRCMAWDRIPKERLRDQDPVVLHMGCATWRPVQPLLVVWFLFRHASASARLISYLIGSDLPQVTIPVPWMVWMWTRCSSIPRALPTSSGG